MNNGAIAIAFTQAEKEIINSAAEENSEVSEENEFDFGTEMPEMTSQPETTSQPEQIEVDNTTQTMNEGE